MFYYPDTNMDCLNILKSTVAALSSVVRYPVLRTVHNTVTYYRVKILDVPEFHNSIEKGRQTLYISNKRVFFVDLFVTKSLQS